MGDVKQITCTTEEARNELASVLSSATFSRSPRLANLLAYLCKNYLDGATDRLTEYNIAVEVLGRPKSFDPTGDAIARVEVHRLRKKLYQHYETPGVDRALRIVIPSGSYVPCFITDEELSTPESPIQSAHGNLTDAHEGSKHASSKQESSKQEISKPESPAETSVGTIATRFSRPRIAALVCGSVAILVALWLLRPQPVRVGRALATASASAVPGPASLATAAAGAADEVRILCGQRKPHTDRLGQVWGADQMFDGGSPYERTRQFLARTSDTALYVGTRSGDFSYDIPVRPGTYEMRLYFAETSYGPGTMTGGGENSRVFQVSANGAVILDAFDIISDAGGPNIADVRVFKDITPGKDGLIHLRFSSQRGQAMVSAIELIPARPHRLNPVRICTQENSYTDSAGRLWIPDNYWSGGQSSIHSLPVHGTPDPDLYASERYGNFSYAIPVADGTYTVTLHLGETYFGRGNPGAGGIGNRVFDIYGNGIALARNVDIYAEAGANQALIKTFSGLKPSAQGKLLLSFVPVKNYASVYAIEVADESK
jgi:hypothetical protein